MYSIGTNSGTSHQRHDVRYLVDVRKSARTKRISDCDTVVRLQTYTPCSSFSKVYSRPTLVTLSNLAANAVNCRLNGMLSSRTAWQFNCLILLIDLIVSWCLNFTLGSRLSSIDSFIVITVSIQMKAVNKNNTPFERTNGLMHLFTMCKGGTDCPPIV